MESNFVFSNGKSLEEFIQTGQAFATKQSRTGDLWLGNIVLTEVPASVATTATKYSTTHFYTGFMIADLYASFEMDGAQEFTRLNSALLHAEKNARKITVGGKSDGEHLNVRRLAIPFGYMRGDSPVYTIFDQGKLLVAKP